jgi:hypothetical protein
MMYKRADCMSDRGVLRATHQKCAPVPNAVMAGFCESHHKFPI